MKVVHGPGPKSLTPGPCFVLTQGVSVDLLDDKDGPGLFSMLNAASVFE